MREMDADSAAFLGKASKVYGSDWEHELMRRANICERTLRRWQAGQAIPGPVRAMILAHEKCRAYGIGL